MSDEQLINLKKHEILCRQEDQDYDLYYVRSGSLFVCTSQGSRVEPLGTIRTGEYVGELSFIDEKPRSANVICLEDCELLKIPAKDFRNKFPDWLLTLAKSMGDRIRKADKIIQRKGLSKKKQASLMPLNLEEQAFYTQLLSKK